jgi:hypothetical protein
MISLSKAHASNGSELLHGVAICQFDWHEARSEYDHSVMDLLATIRRCSTLALTDEEKCYLVEEARKREQAAFIKYKRVLDAS